MNPETGHAPMDAELADIKNNPMHTMGEFAQCECSHMSTMHDEYGCAFDGCECPKDAVAVAYPAHG